MAPPGLFISSAPLHEFLPKLIAVADQIFAKGENLHVELNTNIGIGFNAQNIQAGAISTSDAIKKLLEQVRDASQIIAVHAIVRGPANNPNYEIQYNSADGVLGSFSLPRAGGDMQRTVRTLAALNGQFSITPYAVLPSEKATDAERTAFQIRERATTELNVATHQLTQALADVSASDADSRQKTRAEMDRVYAERQAQLDAEDRKRKDAAELREQTRDAEHAKRVAAFEAREKTFETKESKYVRRELLKEIEKLLNSSKEFSLSDSTKKMRWFVHGFTWALMLLATLSAGLLLRHELKLVALDWKFYVPLAASSATLVTTFIYYLKWNDRWFREHADSEFAATRYRADILRASWVAELAAEWAAQGAAALQPELISAFTRNLFLEPGASRESEHPMEHMMSLMKRATEVNIGKGSFSVRGADPSSVTKSAD